MLRNFINRIVELAAPTTYEIDGHTYANEHLCRIDPPRYMPKSIDVTGLDSVCKLVRNEVKAVGRKIFVQIQAYNQVRVFSTYDDQYERSYLYKCTADTPSVTVNRFNPYENAVIDRIFFMPKSLHHNPMCTNGCVGVGDTPYIVVCARKTAG